MCASTTTPLQARPVNILRSPLWSLPSGQRDSVTRPADQHDNMATPQRNGPALQNLSQHLLRKLGVSSAISCSGTSTTCSGTCSGNLLWNLLQDLLRKLLRSLLGNLLRNLFRNLLLYCSRNCSATCSGTRSRTCFGTCSGAFSRACSGTCSGTSSETCSVWSFLLRTLLWNLLGTCSDLLRSLYYG